MTFSQRPRKRGLRHTPAYEAGEIALRRLEVCEINYFRAYTLMSLLRMIKPRRATTWSNRDYFSALGHAYNPSLSPRIMVGRTGTCRDPPMGANKNGSTAILIRGSDSGVHLLDSPRAYCERLGTPGFYCECIVADRMASAALIGFPFSQSLHEATLTEPYQNET